MTDQQASGHFWINRNFAVLWLGQAASKIGDFAFATALTVWVATTLAAGKPWAPAAVSAVLVATVVPQLVLGPVAGVFVDRWNRRRLMIASDVVRATIVVALAGLTYVPGISSRAMLSAVIGCCVLMATAAQFFDPARGALLGEIIARSERATASARILLTTNLAAVAGVSTAPVLVTALGVRWALAVNAVSFAISAAAITMIRYQPATASADKSARAGFAAELAEGLRFVRDSAILRAVLTGVIAVGLAAGANNAVAYFFAVGPLRTTADRYGVLAACYPLGMIVGALIGGRIVKRLGPHRVYGPVVIVYGIGFLIFSRLTSVEPAYVVMFACGLVFSWFNIAQGPLILEATPRQLTGRVFAAIMPAYAVATLATTALAGTLASSALKNLNAAVGPVTLGPYDTILLAAGLILLTGGTLAYRRLRRHPQTTPDARVITDRADESAKASVSSG